MVRAPAPILNLKYEIDVWNKRIINGVKGFKETSRFNKLHAEKLFISLTENNY